MFISLYLLATMFADLEGNAAVVESRGQDAADAIVALLADEEPLFDGDNGAEKTGALLMSIGHHESRFTTDAFNGHDHGPTQVRVPEMWGSTREKIKTDPIEGYRVALRILRYARERCGPDATAQDWLGAYTAGRCYSAPRKSREICGPVKLCNER